MKELPVIKMFLECVELSPHDVMLADILSGEWTRMHDEGLSNHTFKEFLGVMQEKWVLDDTREKARLRNLRDRLHKKPEHE